jgi:hypothetical protein
MKKLVLVVLLVILLSSCVGEKWGGIYCNKDGECNRYTGWIGHESDSCPEMIEFDYRTAEQYVSIREIYYLQEGNCVD